MNVQVKNLRFCYGNTPILQNVSLSIMSGELFVIVGPNGSGKTTLLRCISGLNPSNKETIFLGMKDLAMMSSKEIAQHLSALEPQINISFDYTVRQVVSLGRIAFSTTPEKNEHIIQQSMRDADILKFSQHSIFNLSSGERQRVWVAMALAQQPKILILDEPTSYLDIKYQMQMLQLMQSLTKKNITVITTIHDLTLACQCATRIAIMNHGEIAGVGSPQNIITAHNIKQVFDVDVDIHYKNEQIIAVIPQPSP